MINVTHPSPNRVDLDISGRIDATAMQDGLNALLHASEAVNAGTMLYTITDLQVPSAGALAVEFGMLPKLFGLIARFDRIAVLSDAAWIRSAAEIEGRLFPGHDIRAYPLEAKADAEAWLSTGSA